MSAAFYPTGGLDLGAWRVGPGRWRFTLCCPGAEAVDLVLFESGAPEVEKGRRRMRPDELTGWSLELDGLDAGQPYGYVVHGPWSPELGLRFNPNKLLLDPRAALVAGGAQAHESMWWGEGPQDPAWHVASAPFMPKAVLAEGPGPFDASERPRHPWAEVLIHEVHVKGATKLHPGIPEALRGTYLGLAHPAMLEHWRRLGVTTLQLLPVHQHLDDLFLLQRGLSNYWGYNTLSYFAPHTAYATQRARAREEFREMVCQLHAAGIEVILDVVYNHHAESDSIGPVLHLRSLDHDGFFRHDGLGNDLDFTGCGHSLNSSSPQGLRLVMDSLRHWAGVMGVDGFRLDLAVTVARNQRHEFDPRCALLAAIAQDPVLRDLKWIAEPWDVGAADSYQVGGFPAPWRELNGRYRDSLRRFWAGEEGMTAEVAKRLCGSQDLYAQRGPLCSVNFVVSHDGFTLRDWCSFQQRHNEANGEDNRDGETQNHSLNCGAEGLEVPAEIEARRDRLRRAMAACLMTSLGVPFWCGGDELGRSQAGNNNAYAQDNALSWTDWGRADEAMLAFMGHLAMLRRRFRLNREEFFRGGGAAEVADILWFALDGTPLTHESWHHAERRGFAALRQGDCCLLWVVNGSAASSSIAFGNQQGPSQLDARDWLLVLDSSLDQQPEVGQGRTWGPGEPLSISAHAVMLFVKGSALPP